MTCLYKIPVSLIAPAMERFLSEFPPVLFAAVQRQRSDLGLLKVLYSAVLLICFYFSMVFLLIVGCLQHDNYIADACSAKFRLMR